MIKNNSKLSHGSEQNRRVTKMHQSRESKNSGSKRKLDKKSDQTLNRSRTSSSSISNIHFTTNELRTFLRTNKLSHFIRSELNCPLNEQISRQGNMITLSGIGKPIKRNQLIDNTSTIAFANRDKLRIFRIE